MVGLAVVGVPYYLFRSRGSKRGLVGTGVFALALVGLWLMDYAGRYVMYFAQR
jgi:hypothetical protein